MKRRTLIPTLVILGVIIAILIYSMASKDEISKPLEAEVAFGAFEIQVNVTGELQALSSIDIKAPMALRSRELRFRSIKIQDLIPEGTVVDSGDYVATLDRSEADNNYKDILDEVEVSLSEYTKTQLDTTLTLEALKMAIVRRQPGPYVIHHTDQGVQYASSEYVDDS